MRAFFLGLIAMLVMACNVEHNEKRTKEEVALEIRHPDEEQVRLNLPIGCEFDSIAFEENDLHLAVSILVPTCIDSKLEHSFQSFIKDWLDWGRSNAKDILSKSSGIPEKQTFRMFLFPETIYSDTSWISYRFRTSWEESGSMHPLPAYLSFTYFIPENRKVEFQDLFRLDSPQDSANFMALVSANLDKPELSLSYLYSLKFNIEEDVISFNFDAYELGSYAMGMPRAVVPKADLFGFLKEKYR